MSHRGRRRGRRGRGRPSIKRWGRREAERTSSQEGSTTGPYALELPLREPPLQVAPPPVNAPLLQVAPPPENAPPPQGALPPKNAPPPQTAPQAGLDPAARMVLESLKTTMQTMLATH